MANAQLTVFRIVVTFNCFFAALAVKYGQFGSACDFNTYCLPVGNWPGGDNNCFNDKCVCTSTTCTEDRECCSGKCIKQQCAKGGIGDPCPTKEFYPCNEKFGCNKNTEDKNVEWAEDSGYGTCSQTLTQSFIAFGAKCTNGLLTICAPFGNWPGGVFNCFNGACACRLREKCEMDHQCCSGECLNGKCSPGQANDFCSEDTCAEALECSIPPADPAVYKPFPSHFGLCQKKIMTTNPSLYRVVCRASENRTCSPRGNWLGYCHRVEENVDVNGCLCSTQDNNDVSCYEDNFCCSGYCKSDAKCAKGLFGDICHKFPQNGQHSCATPKTGGSTSPFGRYECQIPSFDLLITPTFYHRKDKIILYLEGSCKPVLVPLPQRYGSYCHTVHTVCLPLSSWPGGLGNCYMSKCKCRLTGKRCAKDRECCSGQCTNDICDLGKFGDICEPNSCIPGYYCQIPTTMEHTNESFNANVYREHSLDVGTCAEITQIGGTCDWLTICAPFGHWPGGKGNCLNGNCACLLAADAGCKSNDQCCTGNCTNSKCTNGTRGDLCVIDMCEKGLRCKFDAKLKITFRAKTDVGICGEETPYGGPCDESTYCQRYGFWFGGRNNCFEDVCKCRTIEPCENSKQCCSGECTNGRCNPGIVGSICVNNSCVNDLVCKIPPENLDQLKNYHGIIGVCGSCEKLMTECDSKTHCCATNDWLGGLGNCLRGKCNCRLLLNCTSDHQCCTNRCINGICQQGKIGQMCAVSTNTCTERLSCVQLDTAEIGLGICQECLVSDVKCTKNGHCCSGVCKANKCL